ncbi:hypothetical protein E0W68_07860 [Flavobacterium salilacus subsp. salilacus]|uniref:hypothetical protein n=1 Tax=Flavobacterium TaxID=237 RepID=UPI00107554FE|nr:MULTISPECIES: hypothetical protein [Flavobacterium]KAF2518661.1 hypothetical protein E0W68_07860 [Flavobacterium salilacus subsp. salilacus]MBE1613623.1 hypothetical protein [Flavobacterium sp. SaA2.13]
MSSRDIKYDVKSILEKQMPYLIKLLNGKEISWTDINKSFKKHCQSLKKKYKEGDIIEVNIFWLISETIRKNEKSYAMFDFINTTFEQLFHRLNNKELNLTHKLIKNVLMSCDNKYLNFIGEIATLNAYMSTEEIELLNIEQKIYHNKNKHADLFLKRKKDEIKFLVEIVNIHLEDKENKTSEEIEYIINSKLKSKYETTFFDNPSYNLTIQPVIWTNSIEQIKLLEQIFRKHENNVKDIRIPMCHITYQNPEGGYYEHRFEYITTILHDD